MSELNVAALDKTELRKRLFKSGLYRWLSNLFAVCVLLYMTFMSSLFLYSKGEYWSALLCPVLAVLSLFGISAMNIMNRKGWIASIVITALGLVVDLSFLIYCVPKLSKMLQGAAQGSFENHLFLWVFPFGIPLLILLALLAIVVCARNVYKHYDSLNAEKSARNVEFLTYNADIDNIKKIYKLNSQRKVIGIFSLVALLLSMLVSGDRYVVGIAFLIGISGVVCWLVDSIRIFTKVAQLNVPYKLATKEMKQAIREKENK